jgi:hypothetical protein
MKARETTHLIRSKFTLFLFGGWARQCQLDMGGALPWLPWLPLAVLAGPHRAGWVEMCGQQGDGVTRRTKSNYFFKASPQRVCQQHLPRLEIARYGLASSQPLCSFWKTVQGGRGIATPAKWAYLDFLVAKREATTVFRSGPSVSRKCITIASRNNVTGPSRSWAT